MAASDSRPSAVTLARVPSGFRLRLRIQGKGSGIRRLAWSADGARIASAHDDGWVRIWDAEDGSLANALEHLQAVYAVAHSRCGAFIGTAGADDVVRLWRTDDGRLVWENSDHEQDIWDLAFSPDGSLIASASDDRSVGVVHSANGHRKWTLRGHKNEVWGVAFSPDGSTLASSSVDRTIRLWRVADGAPIAVLGGHSNSVFTLAFSPDGSILASASQDGTVGVWRVGAAVEEPGLARVLEGHFAPVDAVSFSSDGRFLASKSLDETVRVWDCSSWETVATLCEPMMDQWHPALAFHPRELRLATLEEGDSVIRIWDLERENLRSAAGRAAVHYTNAKVVFMGESGTGKTCLIRALMGQPFVPQESTHGMMVHCYRSESVATPGGVPVLRETLLWDLAGQPDYRLVNQLFLDQTAVGVILFDPTHPDNPFGGVGYWVKALERILGPDCRRLLVAGRVDRGRPTVTLIELEEFGQRNGFSKVFQTSAKTGGGIVALSEAIDGIIPWERLPVTSSPGLWKGFRDFLLRRGNSDLSPVILGSASPGARLSGVDGNAPTPDQGFSQADVLVNASELRATYAREHPGVLLDDIEFETVINHAQAQGLLWRLSFGGLVLLKPELLSAYASAVVAATRGHPLGLGCVRERDVLDAAIAFQDLKRLPPAQERPLLHAVVELLLAREVALREGEMLVFPSRFNRKRPDSPEAPPREVAYRFAGPVDDIYATLVVRLFYSGAFDLVELWKDVAVFRSAGGTLCHFALEHAPEGYGGVSVYFEKGASLETKVLFLRFIQEHLKRRALADSVQFERIYRCPTCREEVKDRRAVEARLKAGRATVLCQFCEDSIELIDQIEQRFGHPDLRRRVHELDEEIEVRKSKEVGATKIMAKQDIGEFDVFLCHNWEDKPAVRAIGEELKKRGIRPWLDEWELRPGIPWQQELEAQIERILAAAVFVGPKGMGPWQDFEMVAFLRQFVERRCPVIPVVLSGCTTLPKLPVFLAAMTWVNCSEAVPDPMQRLVWGITGHRGELQEAH